MFKHQSSFFCLYYWIQMDLGSLILKGPQCLFKTFELRQGQPKIVISGPLYSYALEFFNARWTIRLWYLYQVHCVEMNSVLCNGMDPWLCIALLSPSMWDGLSPFQPEGLQALCNVMNLVHWQWNGSSRRITLSGSLKWDGLSPSQ